MTGTIALEVRNATKRFGPVLEAPIPERHAA